MFFVPCFGGNGTLLRWPMTSKPESFSLATIIDIKSWISSLSEEGSEANMMIAEGVYALQEETSPVHTSSTSQMTQAINLIFLQS